MRFMFYVFLLTLIPVMVFTQEDKLSAFIEEQNAKLVYHESKLKKVPNLNLLIIPPEYFEEDATLNGFVHRGSATTIQILEVEGVSYNTIDAGMTPEYIASQGFEFVQRKDFQTVTGQTAVIYFVRFISNNIEYERCMFFTGNNKTIWVNVNYPLSIKKLIYPQIESMLYSIQEVRTGSLNLITR